MKAFDAIIIGAGQAGPSMAGRLTASGKTVAIIERKWFGGTCVNTGCMPTKTLVASAYAAHLARRGADFGVQTGPVSVDMSVVAGRARQITLDARQGQEDWLGGMEGCTVVRGHARFTDSQTVDVDGHALTAPLIILNVGGRAAIPDIPGLDSGPYLTNTGIVHLDRLPEHLIILGGSYIALEFAQMYRRFGAKVSVIERSDRLIAREDPDVSDAVRTILEGEGIAVYTGVTDPHVSYVEGQVSVRFAERTVTGSDLLMATGRKPNTDELGLDAAGVKRDSRGYIEVGDDLQTSVPGIYALGDCNGRGAFTHTAYNDFEILAANLLDGETRKVSDRIPGYALYIDPPLGRVGLSIAEAQKTGRRLLIGTRPMTKVGRAKEKGETQGFMRLIADADTKEILGAAILGTGGDEAVHGILDLMNAKAPYTTLQWAVPIHPTVSELWPTVVNEAVLSEH